jgi:hypothetical protein
MFPQNQTGWSAQRRRTGRIIGLKRFGRQLHYPVGEIQIKDLETLKLPKIRCPFPEIGAALYVRGKNPDFNRNLG